MGQDNRFRNETQPSTLNSQRMLILVTYDVSTVDKAGPRRLRRVAQACEDYGVRVQKSVFECQVGQKEWVLLRDRLLSEIKAGEDSLNRLLIQKIEKKRILPGLDLTQQPVAQ